MPDYRKHLKPVLIAIASIVIIGAAFGAGMYVGFERRPAVEKVKGVLGQEVGKPETVDFSQFWDVWARAEQKFVDRNAIDRQKLVYGAIQGMVKALGDPYTVFFPPQEAKQFQEDVRGTFGGIGAEIGIRKNILTIISPLKNSPAARAGLKSGDKILKIDDKPTDDLSLEEAVSRIRGQVDTKVKLTIARDSLEDIHEVTVTREVVIVPVVDTADKGNGIFYIHLMNFDQRSPDEFRGALREFVFSGDKKLILDLRGNAGGFLDAAVDIASWFLPPGEVVARERFGSGAEDLYRSNGYHLLTHTPAVVLVDQGSASAAEILAGALRDDLGIKLIGARTFGKGSVQQVDDLAGGASLKITIAKWLTPKGVSINETGLEPDMKIEISKEDAEASRDPQLEKAIKVLKGL